MFPPNITVGAQDQAIHVWPLITRTTTNTLLAAMEKAKENVRQLLLGFLPDDFTVKISRFSHGNLASHVRSVCAGFSAQCSVSTVACDCDLNRFAENMPNIFHLQMD